jgi:ketosteroid isomerase-like protein
MIEDSNKDLVRTGYEKFTSGDIPGLVGLFSDGEFFKTLDEAEDFAYLEPTEFIAQGNRVVVLGRSKATVKQTGRSYEVDWVHVFTVHEGKITNFAEYFDSALVNKAFQMAAKA